MALSEEDKRKIGGSDCAAVLGFSRHGGPLSVYGRIVDGIEKDDSSAMAAGRVLEPVVLAGYARRTGRAMDHGVAVDRLPRPWMRASLDARSCVPGGTLRLVEAKTGSWRVRDEWGDQATGEIPREYLLQVQFYLGVGLASGEVQDEVADVPLLTWDDDWSITEVGCGGVALGLKWAGVWQVRFDPELYGLILQGLERFWVDHVEPRRPPPLTPVTGDFEYVRKRFPRNTEKHLDWSEIAEENQKLLMDHREAIASVTAAEEKLAKLAARIKLGLQEASGVQHIPGGLRLDWKTQSDGKRPLCWREEKKPR